MTITTDEYGNTTIQPIRDEAFENLIHDVIRDAERNRPRNAQRRIGPSGLGACRERVRAQLFEGWVEPEPPNGQGEWNAAAAIGTLIGHYVETLAAKALKGKTEVPVTIKFPCGIESAGHSDLVVDKTDNRCVDVKTKPRTEDASRWGISDVYLYQLCAYTVGLVQMGTLKEGASATLIYFGRSGEDKRPYAVTLTWEEVLILFGQLDARLRQIAAVQEQLNDLENHRKAGLTPPRGIPMVFTRDKNGVPQLVPQSESSTAEVVERSELAEEDYRRARDTLRSQLRDCSPAYAIATGCPCLEGSPYDVSEPITEPEVLAMIHDYAELNDSTKADLATKSRLKENLRGISGVTPDGHKVIWNSRGALTVKKPKGTA